MVRNKVDVYREANPDEFHTWTTRYGCVVQFWGHRVYYGRCQDCSGLVTTRRNIRRYRHKPITQIGRWPSRCPECAEAAWEKHNDQARYRMARLRARRKCSECMVDKYCPNHA
ncbi:hypothetical protein NN3_21730 [Nocardia neocaledoniensis NBRC 108232]|uniref:Uncharacterized protein n=1 Tax=Nocardia neocaledoniensis TaxID=236511 RepID=A0A317ND74_9NOCA|nr:hypothetical protein DFR69_108106 [Nocardia neocaledoniensis]GEM31166.1 hypothetical protein NN3_21730 [Nocardia neocaledoniensis NBRC 108232]